MLIMKKLLTFGVFDILHYGHVNLFRRSKELTSTDNRLVVAVQDSDFILKFKPDTKIVNTLENRLLMVGAIRYVDEVVVYKEVAEDIMNIDFDILIKGPDQNHPGFQKAVQWCLDNGKEVVEVPRTEGISSSMLKNNMK